MILSNIILAVLAKDYGVTFELLAGGNSEWSAFAVYSGCSAGRIIREASARAMRLIQLFN